MAPSKQIISLALVAFLSWTPTGQAGKIVSKLTDPDHPGIPKEASIRDCYGHEITPAVIETVTEKRLKRPQQTRVDPATGKTVVVQEAVYKTTSNLRIVSPRKDLWFKAICPQKYTKRFVRSLQRALRARNYYSGPLTGWMDDQTNLAVKLYQRQNGLDSSIVSYNTAEDFGLISHRDFNKYRKDDY